MSKKISGFEAFCILITFSVNGILLNAPKILISDSGTGAFLSSILIGIIGLIFLIFLNKLLDKFPSSDIIDISNYLGGKKLSFFVGLLFIAILLFIICVYIAQFVVLIRTVYFKNSPMIFILLFFAIAILICNLNGFGAVKKSICFYFPVSILAFTIVATYNIPEFSVINVTPFFGESFKNTLISGSSNIFIFTNFIFIYFLLPFLDTKKNLKKITITSFVISWTLLILIVTSILSFYPLNNGITDINSIYSLTRRIELSQFIQRSDALFVTIALFSCMSYLSFLFYLITLILKKLFLVENEKMLSYPLITFIIGLTYLMITSNIYKNNGASAFKILFNFTIYIISFLILIFSARKKKKSKQ